jgi:pimeloyl-ACP methyl ester carboxylesterase
MRVTVGDVSLFFDVDGSRLVPAGDRMIERATLLLLHGGPGADHTLFKPEFDALADTAQIVYLDQRGSGRSAAGPSSSWTWTQWADDVADFCRALGIERPFLVGTSSGGLVAMVCAARHPALVGGLILDSTLGVPTSLDETLAVFEARGGRAARAAAARYLGGDTSEATAAAWQEHCLPLYGSPDMAVRRARARMNSDVLEHFRRGECGPVTVDFERIECPALVLAGEFDPVAPAAAAVRLADMLPGARGEVLPGIGHGVFRQAPGEAMTLVRNFLDQEAGGGGVGATSASQNT